MTTHYIKTLSQFFQSVKNGSKTFEVRNNDREYQRGDTVYLEEVEQNPANPQEIKHTGDVLKVIITYVTNILQRDNIIVFGFSMLPPDEGMIKNAKLVNEGSREKAAKSVRRVPGKSKKGTQKPARKIRRAVKAITKKASSKKSAAQRKPANGKSSKKSTTKRTSKKR